MAWVLIREGCFEMISNKIGVQFLFGFRWAVRFLCMTIKHILWIYCEII